MREKKFTGRVVKYRIKRNGGVSILTNLWSSIGKGSPS